MCTQRVYCQNKDCYYNFADVCGFKLAERDEALRMDDQGQCAIYLYKPRARKDIVDKREEHVRD